MSFLLDSSPKVFSDLIHADKTVTNRLWRFATGQQHGNFTLFGPFGTGKTQTAKIIQAERQLRLGLPPSVYSLEAAHWSSQSTLHIENMWAMQKANGDGKPYVIINEADQIQHRDQMQLRALLDTKCHVGQVILTTNHIGSLDKGLQSRCKPFFLDLAKPADWVDRIQDYLTRKNIVLTDGQVLQVLGRGKCSIRDIGYKVDALVASYTSASSLQKSTQLTGSKLQ